MAAALHANHMLSIHSSAPCITSSSRQVQQQPRTLAPASSSSSSRRGQQQHWQQHQQQQQPLPQMLLVGHSSTQRPSVATAAAGRQQQQATAPQSGGGAMGGQVDPDYLSAASYLAELGFASKTEIARVLDIAMNPDSLFVQASVNVNARALGVDADMRPVVEFMQAKGVSKADMVKVISAHPPVLSYSVEGRLVPFWDYLTSIGVQDVAAAVAKRPSILGLSVDASLKKIVEYLQYIETPPDKIADYICNTI